MKVMYEDPVSASDETMTFETFRGYFVARSLSEGK